MAELTGLADDDFVTWRAFSAMRHAIEREIDQRLQRDAGLSSAEFEVLLRLRGADAHRLRAGVLAEALGWEKSRISHQVSRMTSRGLVARAECPTDARGTWVVLTDAGSAALASATCGYVEVLQRAFFQHVDATDRLALRAAADRVIDALDAVQQP